MPNSSLTARIDALLNSGDYPSLDRGRAELAVVAVDYFERQPSMIASRINVRLRNAFGTADLFYEADGKKLVCLSHHVSELFLNAYGACEDEIDQDDGISYHSLGLFTNLVGSALISFPLDVIANIANPYECYKSGDPIFIDEESHVESVVERLFPYYHDFNIPVSSESELVDDASELGLVAEELAKQLNGETDVRKKDVRFLTFVCDGLVTTHANDLPKPVYSYILSQDSIGALSKSFNGQVTPFSNQVYNECASGYKRLVSELVIDVLGRIPVDGDQSIQEQKSFLAEYLGGELLWSEDSSSRTYEAIVSDLHAVYEREHRSYLQLRAIERAAPGNPDVDILAPFVARQGARRKLLDWLSGNEEWCRMYLTS